MFRDLTWKTQHHRRKLSSFFNSESKKCIISYSRFDSVNLRPSCSHFHNSRLHFHPWSIATNSENMSKITNRGTTVRLTTWDNLAAEFRNQFKEVGERAVTIIYTCLNPKLFAGNTTLMKYTFAIYHSIFFVWQICINNFTNRFTLLESKKLIRGTSSFTCTTCSGRNAVRVLK